MRIPAAATPQRLVFERLVFARRLSFTTATKLELITQFFKETVDKRDASAQLLVTELTEKREESRRLDDGLLEAAERFTRCGGNTLEHFRIDGPEHLAEKNRIPHRTNGFIRLGRIDCGFDQTVAGAKRAAQQVENSMIV